MTIAVTRAIARLVLLVAAFSYATSEPTHSQEAKAEGEKSGMAAAGDIPPPQLVPALGSVEQAVD